jgi:hypothetical protein
MKTNIILILAVISAVFLAGCQEETQQPIKSTSGINVTVTEEPTEEAKVESPTSITTKIMSETDRAAYGAALQLEDTSYCDKISEETVKKECKTSVSDQIILNNALSKGDIETCKNLSNTDQQEACKIKIEVVQKEELARLEKNKKMEELMVKTNDIIHEGDVTKCLEVDEEVRPGCELNILVNAASNNQNPALCEQASTKETIETCKKMYTPTSEEPAE